MNLKSNKSRVIMAILSLLGFGLIVASLVVKDEKEQWLLRIPAFVLILVLALIRLSNIGSIWGLMNQKKDSKRKD